MSTHFRLEATDENRPAVCGSIGGSPHIPELTESPRCRMCHAELTAFLEIKLPGTDNKSVPTG